MWKVILELFQRRTLLNRLAACRKFYSAKMLDSKKTISYVSRVRQLAADLKAMNTHFNDQDLAMTVLCGLPTKFEHLIVAIDALSDDVSLTLDFVKNRLPQEHQQISKRHKATVTGDIVLVNNSSHRNKLLCSYCKRRNHSESRCYPSYPHLRSFNESKELVAETKKPAQIFQVHKPSEEFYVCLVESHKQSLKLNNSPKVWEVDSGGTSHMTFDKSVFTDIEHLPPFHVGMGYKSIVTAYRRSTLFVTFIVQNKRVQYILYSALYISELRYQLFLVNVMDSMGVKTSFANGLGSITRGQQMIAEVPFKNRLYVLTTVSDGAPVVDADAAVLADSRL